MNLYAILRRDGFTDGPTLEAAAARSTKVGDDMPDEHPLDSFLRAWGK